jgi:hypothetical protein
MVKKSMKIRWDKKCKKLKWIMRLRIGWGMKERGWWKKKKERWNKME